MREEFPEPVAANDNTPQLQKREGVPSERERMNAYQAIGIFREQVRTGALPPAVKSELLEQIHDIQNALSKGTLAPEDASNLAKALAGEYHVQF